MQSAERQKPRKIRRTSIEVDVQNDPHNDIIHNVQADDSDILFHELEFEPLDYGDILNIIPTNERGSGIQMQQLQHSQITEEIHNTCIALDYGCLYLLDALLLQQVSLSGDHDLLSCHKMLNELISKHGTTSSSLHSEIVESIKLQLHNVLRSKDTQVLIDHIVIVANNVYKVVQRAGHSASTLDKSLFTNQDTDEAMLIVQRIADDLQSMRAKAALPPDDNIWEQIDSSLTVVNYLIDTILSDSQLPHYNEACGPRSDTAGSLPPYYNNLSTKEKDSLDNDDSKRTCELDGLISAVDRLTVSLPRLHDQCFELNERQRNQMDTATMRATIDRLARGRLDNQRANAPKRQTKSTDEFVSNITATNNMEVPTSEKFIDCQQPEQSSQTCKYREQMFITLMRRWLHSILTYGERRMDRHRRKTKAERDLYTLELISRFERLREKTRFHNQDAVMMLCYHELDQIFSHLDKSRKQFSNQRATFRSRTTTSDTS